VPEPEAVAVIGTDTDTDATMVGAESARPASPEVRDVSSRVTTPLLVISLLLAAYAGFRMPNLFSVTVLNMSITDGFHRRIVVGTLLRPFAKLAGYNYWLFAAVGFLVLAAVLTVIIVAALRAKLVSQRFLVIAFLLLPTGGFLFNEVGYLDQVLYLLLFLSLWLLRKRSALVLAAAVMVVSVLVHESAVITVIPIFAYVAVRDLAPRRAFAVVAPSALLAMVVLALPAAEHGAIDRFNKLLSHTNFKPYDLHGSGIGLSITQSWKVYSVKDSVIYLVPIAVIMGAAFLTLHWLGPRGARKERAAASGISPAVSAACAVVAITAPTILAFGGWDLWRWAFLLIANFFIVVWIWLGDNQRELNVVQFVVLGAVLLFTVHASIGYFEIDPRTLHTDDVRAFYHQVRDGSLFDIPTR
jgi:hypothetical protein